MEKRLVKRVKVFEDWYPTSEDGTIRVSFMQLDDGTYRTCAWGDDDFGLELDSENRQEVFDAFNRISDGITQKDLIQMKFKPA